MKPFCAPTVERPFYRKHNVSQLGSHRAAPRPMSDAYGTLLPGPKLPYDEAMRSWFLYAGQPYNVEQCTHDTFTAFIASVTPKGWSAGKRAEYIVLVDAPEDECLLARWYTLEAMVKLKVPGLALYGSRLEAVGKSEIISDF